MRWIVIVLVAAATMMSGRAEAQSAPWQPPRLTPGWVFTPSVMLGGMWDSNVTVRNEGNTTFVREWVGLVNPRGEVDYNGRRLRFNTGYSGALEAYQHASELNTYEQKGRVSTLFRASPRLQAEGRATYTRSPSTDRLEMTGSVPYVYVGGRWFETGGGFVLKAAARTQVGGRYQFQHATFDKEAIFVRDVFLIGGYSQGPGFDVQHSLTSRLTIGSDWQYNTSVFDGGRQSFSMQTMLGRVSYQVREHTSVSAAAGAQRLDVDSDDLEIWGPSYRVGLQHQLDRTSVSVGYSRTFGPSFAFGGLVGTQEVSASVTAPLTRGGRLLFRGMGAYSSAQPVEGTGAVGFGLKSFWTSASVGYQVSPWLRAEGFFVSTHQNSTVRGNFDRTRAGIQFVTFKPVRIQ